ncbi:hypothetical protein GCM10027413_09500 [Conyzicola nivalis]|uniref:HupE/UreJ family protein n=1 Tax=Conyzicola nivalis TaxID=1477021 RepID=A0A916WJ52_9MICO|nr:HupE/UreJ family protein [Conyzicola nivalis]GGB03065.1 hypothetical protein GCM10010979_17130 [Conyzicola nivalis]
MHLARPRRRISTVIALLLALAATAVAAAPASAHGFSSTAYVDVSTSRGDGALRTTLDLEYDLLVVSAAENENDDDLFQEGMDLFETGDEAVAMNAHAETVVDYATKRFTVAADGASCTASLVGDITVHIRDDVPYATMVLDQDCAETEGESAAYEFDSALFPDSEGYVTDTKTIVDYDIDGEAGSAALDAQNPTFSTEQAWTDRFAEFFLLGAEHLLGGLDHILFLLALIVGSRRLRDVVLAATTFTVAHSVTFLLAALGVVNVPAAVVEPLIALSIAIVAGWYLWGTWRRRPYSATFETTRTGGRFGLDRSDWTRLVVVFAFGLMHGLGFAGALGIQEAWSWTLLWSLLVFNVGIEVVQLGLIAIIFPVLTILRRRAPRVGLWTGIAIAAVVTVMGLIWFVERILGLG